MEEQTRSIRVDITFFKRVMEFIKQFEKAHSIIISTAKATKIIDEKIEANGGLIVD